MADDLYTADFSTDFKNPLPLPSDLIPYGPMVNLLHALSMLETSSPSTGHCEDTASLNRWESLLLSLLSIPSETGSEEAIAQRLEKELALLFPTAQVWLQPVEDRRWNVLLERGNPKVTLTTHIDTVPGGPAPRYTNERIYGRGACDAKGQLVAQLWGLSEAIERGLSDYRCAFVVGEETDAVGARALVTLKPTEFLINGEPTNNQFVSQGWGIMEVEVTASGTSAHSSLGSSDSAIHKLITEVNKLLSADIPGTIINVGTITGGLASNIQAPSASCVVSIRLREGLTALEEALNKTFIRCAWRPLFPPTAGVALFVPPRFKSSAVEVKFASDCSVYVEKYKNVMLFGPGSILEAHTSDESVGRAELREGAGRIAQLLIELAG